MKEATGELNMTVVTVVAIAAIGAFFYAFIWPSIKNSMMASTICANGANYTQGSTNQSGYVKCGTMKQSGKNTVYTCSYATTDANGSVTMTSTTCRSK